MLHYNTDKKDTHSCIQNDWMGIDDNLQLSQL